MPSDATPTEARRTRAVTGHAVPPMLHAVVKDACQRLGIGPNELARRCGLARETLDDVSTHKRRTVALHVFAVLARETGIGRDELERVWEAFEAWRNGVKRPPEPEGPARCATCSYERTPGGAVCFGCGASIHRVRAA